jgi:hypothetical protein
VRLTFDADHLRQLLDLSRSADRRTPVLEQLVDPEMWRRDLPKTRRTLLDREVALDGLAFSARSEDVDPALIGPGLILVGDQGVYLMSNAPVEAVKAAGVSHVAYAAEADPTALPFEEWWDNKRASFGPDDGTVFLPEELISGPLSRVATGAALALEVTETEIEVLEPEEPGPDC